MTYELLNQIGASDGSKLISVKNYLAWKDRGLAVKYRLYLQCLMMSSPIPVATFEVLLLPLKLCQSCSM